LLVEGAGDDVAYNGNGNGGVGVGGKVGVGEMILQQLLQKASLSRTSLSLSLSLSRFRQGVSSQKAFNPLLILAIS
jgi:hypothetical protein